MAILNSERKNNKNNNKKKNKKTKQKQAEQIHTPSPQAFILRVY